MVEGGTSLYTCMMRANYTGVKHFYLVSSSRGKRTKLIWVVEGCVCVGGGGGIHSLPPSTSMTPVIHCTSSSVRASRLYFTCTEPLLPLNVEPDTQASNAIEVPTYPIGIKFGYECFLSQILHEWFRQAISCTRRSRVQEWRLSVSRVQDLAERARVTKLDFFSNSCPVSTGASCDAAILPLAA